MFAISVNKATKRFFPEFASQLQAASKGMIDAAIRIDKTGKELEAGL